MIRPTVAALATLLAGAASAAPAQDTDSAAAPAAWAPPRPRPLMAVGQALFINAAVNRFDAWARGEEWAKVRPQDWSRNLRIGWEWDENEFGTNTFSHPFHGSLYFNAARANGLDFWEAAPVAFLGSWTWEYLGERFRPALNDFFFTSFGGIALGEMFHRVAATIRDNEERGGPRLWHEVSSLPFDPVGGLNRLLRGEWTRRGPNPPEHDPGAFVFQLNVGARAVSDSNSIDSVTGSPTILLDLSYGDPFVRPYRAPFDVFSARAQVSPGGGGLNQLRTSGRLYGRDITHADARNRHLFLINQRFEYVNNAAYKFGAQSVEGGILSRWQIRGDWGLRTRISADLVIMGALDAPYAGFGERTYDFGPGGGLSFDVALEKRGVPHLALTNRFEYIHSVSGAEADHSVAFSGFELTVSVARGVGLGVQTGLYDRRSRYSDQPDARRQFPEARLFLTWTASARPPRAPAIPSIVP